MNDGEKTRSVWGGLYSNMKKGSIEIAANAEAWRAGSSGLTEAGIYQIDKASNMSASRSGTLTNEGAWFPASDVNFLLPKYMNTFIIPSCFLRLSLISRDISRPVLQAAHFGSAQESSFCGFGSSRFFRVGSAAAVTEPSIRHSGFTCLFASFWTLDTGEMGTKLYVGNLSFRVTSDDLQEHFATAGQVDSANVVMDRETGRSRGFGFVEMASDDDATAAIAQFNGSEYDGRNMVVNEARPREDNRGGGGGGGGGYGGGGGGRDRGNYGDDRGYGGGSRW
jgi:RNA recognition motif. (a.k.a. RRM, RBD, or RNP domain)